MRYLQFILIFGLLYSCKNKVVIETPEPSEQSSIEAEITEESTTEVSHNDSIYLDQLWEELANMYADSVSASENWHGFDDFFLDDIKSSKIDSCKIEPIGVYTPMLKLTKDGGMLYYQEIDVIDSNMPAVIIDAYIIGRVFKYLEKIYFTPNYKKYRSSSEMREGTATWDETIEIEVYSSGRCIKDRLYGRGGIFEGNRYDYSYDVFSLLTLIQQLFDEYRMKFRESDGLLPDRNVRNIKPDYVNSRPIEPLMIE